jgi:DNA-binding response OmpR family regulator
MPSEPSRPLQVLVYSDNSRTREQVHLGLGRRPAVDLPEVEFVDAATPWAVHRYLSAGGIDLAILDGEAAPAGGLGVCRSVKDEIFHAPPLLVLLGRPQDDWLAAWSRADGVASHPIDPFALTEVATGLLRSRRLVSSAGSSARGTDSGAGSALATH